VLSDSVAEYGASLVGSYSKATGGASYHGEVARISGVTGVDLPIHHLQGEQKAMLADPIINILAQSIMTRGRLALPQSARGRLNKRVKDAIGTTSEEPMGALMTLVAESDLRAFNLRRGSVWWSRAYYMLGLPAAILAAVSGATGLASTTGRFPAAIIALVAAGLTASATFLNSGENSKKNKMLSAEWQRLADETRILLLQCAQKLENTPVEQVIDSRYWKSVLDLQRRKGQLLRGDIPSTRA
jgi:hypothetical protein